MSQEAYDLKLGKQFIVVVEASNAESLQIISEKLQEIGASTIFSSVFSVKFDAGDIVESIENTISKIEDKIGKGDTLLFIYNDGDGLSGKFVLVREERPGEGIRVMAE